MNALRVSVAILLTAAVALAGEVGFTSQPVATREGSGARIRFAVSAPTDVEVAVIDAKGEVVRHLFAAALKADALAQSLAWDGKDDLGKPAAGGPFRVRVALGMTPVFDRMIGYNPGGLGMPKALAVAPDGTLYVWHRFGELHPGDATTVCVAYDRDGTYLRQVIPYPANLPAEKLTGLRRLTVEGTTIPFIYQGETRTLVPGLGDLPPQRAVATRDGRIAFVGVQEWVGTTLRYTHGGVAQMVVLNGDGSTADGKPLRAIFGKDVGTGVNLALSPDEKTLYATNIRTGTGRKAKYRQCVYKLGWDDEKPTVFVGDPDTAGDDATHFNNPVSVASDGAGNVYVADVGNNRICVFDAAGKPLGRIAVERPLRVEVHPKTGAVYVLGGPHCNLLSKFGSYRDPKPSASTEVPHYKHKRGAYRALMALDGSADAPVVWIGSTSNWAGFKLLRIEEKDGAFGEPVDIAQLPKNRLPNAGPRTRYKQWTGGAISGMALDKVNDRLYLNNRRVDLATGKWSAGMLWVDGEKNGVGSFGLDGNCYSQLYLNKIARIAPDGTPLPFPGSDEGTSILRGPEGISYRLRGRGITADAAGNIYILRQKSADEKKPGDSGDANNLVLRGPDGAVRNSALIDSAIRQISSVRLDYQGNIYVAVGVRPKGKTVPAAFEGMDLGRPWKYSMNSHDLNWYTLMYGCIVKFGPEGGVIRTGAGGMPVEYSWKTQTEIKGAKWMFYGASNVASWRLKYPDTCLCESPRFDVDGYGRSFFPDCNRFRVGVLDTDGRPITWFGSYGNQDSAGAGSKIATPAIPFYWPFFVFVDERMVYVGDRLNRRVVAVKLTYAREQTCDIN